MRFCRNACNGVNVIREFCILQFFGKSSVDNQGELSHCSYKLLMRQPLNHSKIYYVEDVAQAKARERSFLLVRECNLLTNK